MMGLSLGRKKAPLHTALAWRSREGGAGRAPSRCPGLHRDGFASGNCCVTGTVLSPGEGCLGGGLGGDSAPQEGKELCTHVAQGEAHLPAPAWEGGVSAAPRPGSASPSPPPLNPNRPQEQLPLAFPEPQIPSAQQNSPLIEAAALKSCASASGAHQSPSKGRLTAAQQPGHCHSA